MNGNKAKKIATWIIVPFMAAVFILDIITVAVGNHYSKRYTFTQETFTLENGDDRIHFLNTANSDCIMLESNGRFALVDSGEGNCNPRRHGEYVGYEERVINYIKKTAAGEDGKAHLDFVLATHYHYDHVGNFEPVLRNNDIVVGTAYFKKYEPRMDKELEKTKWGMPVLYEKMVSAAESRGVELVQKIPERIEFGDFSLKLYNTGYYEDLYGKGENSSSIGIRIEKNGRTAFLAADITGPSGVEKKLAGSIGHCDLLKIGHHGYYGSSTCAFLKEISPEIAIVTNMQGKVYPNVKWNLTMYAHVPFYGTYDHNGIIATFTDDGEIIMTDNIHT